VEVMDAGMVREKQACASGKIRNYDDNSDGNYDDKYPVVA
jgi:hypothetical protein